MDERNRIVETRTQSGQVLAAAGRREGRLGDYPGGWGCDSLGMKWGRIDYLETSLSPEALAFPTSNPGW